MGFDANLICVRKDYRRRLNQFLRTLGLPPAKDFGTGTWEDALGTLAPGRAIGFTKGWTVLSDPLGFETSEHPQPKRPKGSFWPARIDAGLARLSQDAPALGFVFCEDVPFHGFTVHLDGRRRRCRTVGDVPGYDFGRPTPQEKRALAAEAAGDEQYRLFQIMREYGIPPADLPQVEFTFVSRTDDVVPEPGASDVSEDLERQIVAEVEAERRRRVRARSFADCPRRPP